MLKSYAQALVTLVTILLASSAYATTETAPAADATPAKPAAVSVMVQNTENHDFIDYASRHCAALLQGGKADLGFMLGTSAAKFFAADMDTFNSTMGARIVKDYELDASKGCTLDMVSVGQRNFTSHAPKRWSPKRDDATPAQDMAIVGGRIQGTKGAPISVVYRFERLDKQAWVITNITFNGQPMVDRYRDALDEKVAEGGVKNALEAINSLK